jgi:hypothetical protein
MRTGSRKDLKDYKKGWQKSRAGSSREYNTNILESDFEVMHQLLEKVEAQKTRTDIKKHYDAELTKYRKDNGADAVPEGWIEWNARPGSKWFKTEGLGDDVVNAVMNAFDNVKDLSQHEKGLKAQIDQIIASAVNYQSPKDKMYLPDRVAKTMDSHQFMPSSESPLGKAATWTMGKWKQYILLNPLRLIKYNLNNMSGDLDISIAENPRIAVKLPNVIGQLNELAKGRETLLVRTAKQYGVIESGQTINEIQDINKTDVLKELTGKSDLNIVAKYFHGAREITQYRENLLRLASMDYFMNEGKNSYGASKKVEIDQIADPTQRAAKKARELMGDYGNLSEAGQYLRTHLIPFYSWLEINSPRYVRLIKNAGIGKGAIAASGKIAVKGAQALLLAGAVSAYNRVVHPNEERELSEQQRNQLHLILGRTKDGRIRTMRFQGALSDVLDWAGASDLLADIAQLRSGEKSWGQYARETTEAPINKLTQGLRPDVKMFAELVSGKRFYPSVFRPSKIRDKWQHAVGPLSAELPYRLLTGKPTSGISQELGATIYYTSDPGENAYNDLLDAKYNWLEKTGKEFTGGEPTARSNALYNYKLAKRKSDEKAVEKYLGEYKNLGGTDKGIGQSLALMTPLGGLKDTDTKALLEALPKEKLQLYDRAYKWFTEKMLDPDARAYVEARIGTGDQLSRINNMEKYIREYYKLEAIEKGEIAAPKTRNPYAPQPPKPYTYSPLRR